MFLANFSLLDCEQGGHQHPSITYLYDDSKILLHLLHFQPFILIFVVLGI